MIDKLNEIIKNSNNIVFFGGAGVSTASGIPDFRSKDGIYNNYDDLYPEEILTHSYYMTNPQKFYDFYRTKFDVRNILPNIIHQKLVALEEKGKLKCIITQNIDGLHTKAGSKNVLEIHGSIYRNYCLQCHQFYESDKVFDTKGIPYCSCGGMIKPDIVLYEEPLNDTFDQAIEYVSKADTLIIAGTSLNVYPAASLIHYFQGKNLILINKDKTPYDKKATLIIHDLLENVFADIVIDDI